ncbi:50S ribosomal protein L24 [Cuniculiplasma sp. SKW3]|uniref:50S ribosomal protein L24 n=1 Tax=Cuniculiplasma sp. SKW3 TaxID=3400170 RepID=UPI003FD3379A
MMNKVKITLSGDLRKKLGIRQFPVMKGDLVEVVKGNRKGEGGKVSIVDHRHGMIVIEGINIAKADGKEKEYKISPEKVVIKKLDLSDEKREARLKELAAAKNVSLSEEVIEESKVIAEPAGENAETVDSQDEGISDNQSEGTEVKSMESDESEEKEENDEDDVEEENEDDNKE